MTRITTTVMVVVLLMNGAATIMDVSGLSEDLGVEMETGVSDKVEELNKEIYNAFNPNIGSLQSLISLALAALDVFELVISAAFAAPTMVTNILGGGQVVQTVVTGLFLPLYAISALETIAISLGTETV